MGVPEWWGFEAVPALNFFVPVVLDRGTLESGGEGEGDKSRPDGVNCYLTNSAEAGVAGEDVEVEVEEGELSEGDEHLVEDLVDVKVLVVLVVYLATKTRIIYHARHLDILDAIVLDQVLNMVTKTPPKHC